MKSKRREIKDMLEHLEEKMLCIRDFNAKIRKEGKRIEEREDEESGSC